MSVIRKQSGMLLLRHGFTRASSEAHADIIIVNTCSVRGKAEDKALGKLGLLAAGKRDYPGRIVGAIGCVVQQLKEDIRRKVPGLDFAVGTHRIGALPGILALVIDGKGPIIDTVESPDHKDDLALHAEGAITAFVNILYGCNRRCTYCVVPAVRGSEWSRPAAKVLDEVKQLAYAGVREIILLGQSVMSYGLTNQVWSDSCRSDRGFKEPLPRLLEAVDAVEGIERIRFTSGHPSGCTEELATAMSDLPSVCEHLHLPLQSASDRILAMMVRGYNADDYRKAIERLRQKVPEIAITTDIIVGFPTETDEDFEITASFMDEIGFDNAFIFKYSPRPDTPAMKWNDDVPAKEKMLRNKVLLAGQDEWGLAINSKLIGQKVEVLIEGASVRNSSRSAGRTRTNKIVIFDPINGSHAGDLVKIEIERVSEQTLYGKCHE